MRKREEAWGRERRSEEERTRGQSVSKEEREMMRVEKCGKVGMKEKMRNSEEEGGRKKKREN